GDAPAETQPLRAVGLGVDVDGIARVVPAVRIERRRRVEIAQDRPFATQLKNAVDDARLEARTVELEPEAVVAARGASGRARLRCAVALHDTRGRKLLVEPGERAPVHRLGAVS